MANNNKKQFNKQKMSLNKATLIGNVGSNPEIRSMPDGKEIVTLSIATSEHWKDKNSGEKKEKTEWHRVVVLSQGLVKVVKNYVDKGTKLYIEGQIQTRKWTDKQGVEKYSTEIVLQNYNSILQILSSRQKEGVASVDPVAKDVVVEEDGEDDIPF